MLVDLSPSGRCHDPDTKARLEQGEELAIVSRILGHASVSTTMNVYGHLTDTMLDRAVQGPTRWSPEGRVGLKGYDEGYDLNRRARPDGPDGLFRAQNAGEPGETRTPNQLIKSQLLCH